MNSTSVNNTFATATSNITLNVTRPRMAGSAHVPMLARDADDSTTELLLEEQEQLASTHTSLVAISLVLAFVLLAVLGAVGYRCWTSKRASHPPKSKQEESGDQWSGATVTSPDKIWSSMPQSNGNHVEMV